MLDSVHVHARVFFWGWFGFGFCCLLWGLVLGLFFCCCCAGFFVLFWFGFFFCGFLSFFKGEEGGVVRCPMPCLPRSLVLRAAGCKPAMYAYHKGWLISESGEHEDIEGRKKKMEVELRLHSFPWGYSGWKGQFCLYRWQKFLPFTCFCYMLLLDM